MDVEKFEIIIITSIDVIEKKLSLAQDELNELSDITLNRSLRVNLFEIRNIVDHTINDICKEQSYDLEKSDFVDDSLDEIAEELYLSQYSGDINEVMSDFRTDFIKIINNNPVLMTALMPILSTLKKDVTTGIGTHRKFKSIVRMSTDLLVEIENENYSEYVFRAIEEIVDFSKCMTLEGSAPAPKLWAADNDNKNPKSES